MLTGSIALMFAACSDAPKDTGPDAADTLNPPVVEKEVYPAWNDSVAPGTAGIAGVFEMPEVLSLCKLDSAEKTGVSKKLSQNFSILEKDLNEIKSEVDGAQGIIYYNNDPENFKFECFLPLKRIPAKKPRHSQVVVLESCKMLVYNYYGPFENTYKAYAELKDYLSANKWVQIGPAREIYPLTQSDEKDQSKWLTRIMLPVVKEQKKEEEKHPVIPPAH